MHKNKVIIILYSFLLLIPSFGAGQNCDCHTNLDSLIKHVEDNYVGFEDKITPANRNTYDSFVDSLRKDALTAFGQKCYTLLNSYLDFYQDPHLNINIKVSPMYVNDIRKMFINESKIDIDINSLKKHFKEDDIDSIEGIWQLKEQGYEIAIFKDQFLANNYTGVILRADSIAWFPGQIKLRIQKDSAADYNITFFRKDHTPSFHTGYQLLHNKLVFNAFGTWTKVYPTDSSQSTSEKESVISFRKISDNCAVLTMKSFSIEYKKVTDSIIDANASTIKQLKYLIIDIRDNGGGVIMTYLHILPFLYTNPIISDPVYVKSSPANIADYERSSKDTLFPERTRNAFREMVKKMKRNGNGLVKINDGGAFSYDSTFKYPEKIGIIVNRGTASAAEFFLFQAMQSKKVTIFGTNTRGALDYTEVALRTLPCPYFIFNCPMGRSDKISRPLIDNIGIKPNVLINKNNKDWVYFIQNYFKGN
jgi:hypothetical protein